MDQREVYEAGAELYDRLVSAEDHDGNLVSALRELAPFEGARFLDVGAGTGRVSRIARALGAAELTLVEPAPAMLDVARERIADATFIEAPADAMPLDDASFDVAVAGWVFGHLRHWFEDDWRARIARALGEVRRALRPGGTLIVIETMGTMTAEIGPPSAALAEYYAWLESAEGFEPPRVVSTDYVFESVDEAAEVVGGFFGEAKGERVRASQSPRIGESTGIWRGAPR